MSIIFAILLSVTGFAGEPAALLGFYPSRVLRNETVQFKPIAGHHFSPDAPQACGSGQLVERNPRAIKCQFTQSGATRATLNICDDKLTFCRAMPAALEVAESNAIPPALLTKNQTLNKDLHRRLVPGFSEGPREEVIKQAETRGQPVFVMVSTDWCPPCNEAKEYLLSSEAFQRVSQNWFKVYVDGDSLDAADWEKTVPYAYFPTFALLNSQMQELGRYNGELRQDDFETWAKEISNHVNDPIASLRERVLARRDGSLKQRLKDFFSGVKSDEKHRQEVRLLRWAIDQEQNDVVSRLLPGEYPEIAPQVLRAELDQLERREKVEGKDLKPVKIEKTKALLTATFKRDHWGEALLGLCDLDMAACKPYLAQIGERLQFMEQRPGLRENERESALADELFSLTQVYQEVGDKAQAHAFSLKCVDHFDALKKKSLLKISRAGQQGMVACLEMAGDYAREERVLKDLMAAYPTEPTFMNRLARMMHKQKKYDKALQWIHKAEGLAYGYNWFMLQALKVDTLLDLKRPAEAKTAVDGALAQVSLDARRDSRNQGLLARLRALQEKVQKTQ